MNQYSKVKFYVDDKEEIMPIDDYAKWLALCQAMILINEKTTQRSRANYKTSAIRAYVDAKWEEYKYDLINHYESANYEVVSSLVLL